VVDLAFEQVGEGLLPTMRMRPEACRTPGCGQVVKKEDYGDKIDCTISGSVEGTSMRDDSHGMNSDISPLPMVWLILVVPWE